MTVPQVYLVLVSSVLMGAVFGLSFGLLDVEDDTYRHQRFSKDEFISSIVGAIIGALVGALNQWIRHVSDGRGRQGQRLTPASGRTRAMSTSCMSTTMRIFDADRAPPTERWAQPHFLPPHPSSRCGKCVAPIPRARAVHRACHVFRGHFDSHEPSNKDEHTLPLHPVDIGSMLRRCCLSLRLSLLPRALLSSSRAAALPPPRCAGCGAHTQKVRGERRRGGRGGLTLLRRSGRVMWDM